jgi:L,D-transpeptidase ErfK/SrfK
MYEMNKMEVNIMRNRMIVGLIIIALMLPMVAFARLYGQILCQSSGFYCIHIKRNQSWQSLWPDEQERDIVMRINRLNIRLYPGLVIAVPKNLKDADIMDFAPLPRHISSPHEKVLVFDPASNAWGAYDPNGRLIRWGPASGGSNWCHDLQRSCRTRSGSFRLFSLGGSNCISHKFPLPRGGAPMPYCMYFSGGQAFHGEPNGLPGYNASHGCIRLYVRDAEWLRYDFVEPPNANNGYRGTKVIVGPYL